MRILTTMLRQKAVYWPLLTGKSAFDRFGKPAEGTPIEIKCRWEEATEEYLDKSGNKQVSQAVVYVDRDLVTSGHLWFGQLADLPSSGIVSDGVWEIMKFDKLPTLKADKFLRTTYL